jgi:transcriptional antiterminator NusG
MKTSIGYERMVADKIARKAKKSEVEIYSILSPGNLRGYLLMECIDNREAILDFVKGIKHLRSVIDGDTSIEDRCRKCKTIVGESDENCPNCGTELGDETRDKGIAHFLTPKPAVSGIVEGDIVEIVSGPFKGEKAKVRSKDEAKEEITVELLEAMVAIPVTIRGDSVRVLKHHES